MSKPVVFDENIARELMGIWGQMTSYVDYKMKNRSSPDPTREKQIRVAKTVSNNFPYPSGSSRKYEIQLGEPTFDNTNMDLGEVQFTPYPGNNQYRIASSISEIDLAEGELCYVALCHGRWYILTGGGGSGTLAIAFDTGGYPDTTPTAQVWYVAISRVSNSSPPSEDPSDYEKFPEGTTLLYKANSYDVNSQGDAYNTFAWIFQTCNDSIDMAEWLDDNNLETWVSELPENSGNPNDAWTLDPSQYGRTTVFRDDHLDLMERLLHQPVPYDSDDLVGPIDSDECDPDNKCSNIPSSAYESQRELRVKIISRTCGLTKVPGEDEDGYVTVVDRLDAFLYGRTENDLTNRKGVALRMQDEGEYECYWMITYMDMFDEIQVVSDIIIGSRGILIERKRVDIWRECDLPDEYIEGNTCEDS